jgi:sialic acid synthase SpsE
MQNQINTKIILEIGCNHQGDIDMAKVMIDEAAMLKVWAVKFQKRDIESIPDELKHKPRNFSNSFVETYYKHRKALEFDCDQLMALKLYAESKGLIFICSAFDEKSVNDLISIDCRYVKLPSQLYSNDELKKLLLSYKKQNRIKVLLSTGMHSHDEIINNDWLDNADYLFHCISIYPHYLKEMNLIFLNCLSKLSENHNFIPGFSSHDYRGEGIRYAVIAGAKIIERHYTLNKNLKGSDHSTVSSDFEEMERIIKEIKEAEDILGDEKRICSDNEKSVRLVYRGF